LRYVTRIEWGLGSKFVEAVQRPAASLLQECVGIHMRATASDNFSGATITFSM